MDIRSAVAFVVIFALVPVSALDSDLTTPFSNRIIFSQTPEIGEPWRGGIRNNDILLWDAYWNCGGWLTFDLMSAGLKQARLPGENGDTITLTDYLTLFTIKSKPLTTTVLDLPYKIAGGVTVYASGFRFVNQIGEGIVDRPSRELAFFLTQRVFMANRHYFNLVTTLSLLKTASMDKVIATLYLIPGYRFFFDRKKRWSFDVEHYLMNPVELPIKTLQYGLDPDVNEFYNHEQLFVSFTFWGFSYSRNHLRLEFHLGHHVSFGGPIIPLIGAGWDF